jgi:hypothetical protein
LVFITATIAMLLFAAGTMGYFLTRNHIWESVVLLLIAFSIFRPGFWMDMMFPPYLERAPAELVEAAGNSPPGQPFRMRVRGVDRLGDPVEFVVQLELPDGATGEERLQKAGMKLKADGEKMIIDNVQFGSPAKAAGLDWDQEVLQVLRPVEQPSKYLIHIPAFLLLGLIVWLQRRRTEGEEDRKNAVGAAA